MRSVYEHLAALRPDPELTGRSRVATVRLWSSFVRPMFSRVGSTICATSEQGRVSKQGLNDLLPEIQEMLSLSAKEFQNCESTLDRDTEFISRSEGES